MKYLKMLFCLFLMLGASFTLPSTDNPIIFLHGNQSVPEPDEGWLSWNNQNSAMMKIINTEYEGYKTGNPRDCHKNTTLQTMPDSKRIYNFSYYNPDGSRGVIGSNGNYYPADYTTSYLSSASNACWAEHLADFIDKVLNATGATQVDIVAHSMGGLIEVFFFSIMNRRR